MKTLLLTAVMILVACHKEPKELKKENTDSELVGGLRKFEGTTAKIKADVVNLRSDPKKDAKVVRSLSKNTEVQVLERTLETEEIYGCPHYWFKVSVNNTTGWVYGELLYHVVDKARKPTRFPTREPKLEMHVPSSWTDKSVWDDIDGGKIAESHVVREYTGDFKTFVETKFKKRALDDDRNISLTKFKHKDLEIYKAITEVTYEGGCPNWVGVWFPVTYYIKLNDKTYLSFSLYLRDLNDSHNAKLFDGIADTLRLL